jgi:hypothetical protein
MPQETQNARRTRTSRAIQIRDGISFQEGKSGTEHVFREQVAEQVPGPGNAAAAGGRAHRQGTVGVDERRREG